MKKLSVVLVVVLSLCLVVSLAFAADMKGTVKSVDAKAHSIVVTVDGKDHTLKADKSVDLGKVKAGEAVELSVEKDTVKSIKAAAAAAAPAAKKKAPVGC
jgi:type 1 fimbria pilin